LVLADREGNVVIYKDENIIPISRCNIVQAIKREIISRVGNIVTIRISNIIENIEMPINNIKVHDHYLIIKLNEQESDYYDRYVFDLDTLLLNGRFKMHEDNGYLYSGKYIIEEGEHTTDNSTGLSFYDLDTLEKKKNNITDFEDLDDTVLRSQGKIIFFERESAYNREMIKSQLNLTGRPERLPIDKPLNKERHIYCL
jgi:hypothetical protein